MVNDRPDSRRTDRWTWVEAFTAADQTAPERVVCLALLTFMDDSGSCWPSVDSIADRARIGRSTAERALTRLTRAGWVQKRQRRGQSTLRQASVPTSDASPQTSPQTDEVDREIVGAGGTQKGVTPERGSRNRRSDDRGIVGATIQNHPMNTPKNQPITCTLPLLDFDLLRRARRSRRAADDKWDPSGRSWATFHGILRWMERAAQSQRARVSSKQQAAMARYVAELEAWMPPGPDVDKPPTGARDPSTIRDPVLRAAYLDAVRKCGAVAL